MNDRTPGSGSAAESELRPPDMPGWGWEFSKRQDVQEQRLGRLEDRHDGTDTVQTQLIGATEEIAGELKVLKEELQEQSRKAQRRTLIIAIAGITVSAVSATIAVLTYLRHP